MRLVGGASFLLSVLLFGASEVAAVEQWAARYNGPANSYDKASAVALDTAGNIYVTGGSIGTGWDYATIKYDPAGSMKWLRRHNGNYGSIGSTVDYARAMAVDGAGNVHVTGESSGVNGWRAFLTMKYDANGSYLWSARYNRGSLSTNMATALAVDRSGNVLVTGYTYLPSTSTCDITTVKYDKNGVQKWARHYTSPLGGVDDRPAAIAVDYFGNVYVAGYSPGLVYVGGVPKKTGRDIVLIKYDTNGTQKWLKRYNGPGNGTDESRALKVVTKLYPTADVRVYVAGYSRGGGTQGDYATIRYDFYGTQKWLMRYQGPAAYPDVNPVALGVDAGGNVYVTGSATCPSEYMTLKYSSTGVLQWARRFHMGQQWDLARAMAVTGTGDVYVTGLSYPPGAVSFDIVTVKYDSGGTLKWTERYNGPGNGYDEPAAIAVDGSGNVYVTGWSVGDGTREDYVTLKYPPH